MLNAHWKYISIVHFENGKKFVIDEHEQTSHLFLNVKHFITSNQEKKRVTTVVIIKTCTKFFVVSCSRLSKTWRNTVFQCFCRLWIKPFLIRWTCVRFSWIYENNRCRCWYCCLNSLNSSEFIEALQIVWLYLNKLQIKSGKNGLCIWLRRREDKFNLVSEFEIVSNIVVSSYQIA